MLKTSNYKGYQIRYDIDANPIKGSVKGIGTIVASNETKLITMFHNAVKAKIDGRTPILVDPATIRVVENVLPKNHSKVEKEYTPKPTTHFIVGDILAPRLADVFLVEECKLITKKLTPDTYLISTIDESGIIHDETISIKELSEKYKIISHFDEISKVTAEINKQATSKRNLLKVRDSIENIISDIDKDDETVYNDLVSFIKNSIELTDIQKDRYLKIIE